MVVLLESLNCHFVCLVFDCVLKHTHRHTRVHVESQWRQQRQCDDLRVTSDFLPSPLRYICVTPTHHFRIDTQREGAI